MKNWMSRVRDTYGSIEDLQSYQDIFGLVKRAGFKTAAAMWRANPFVGGSVHPEDYGVVSKAEQKKFSKRADRNGTHHRLARYSKRPS